MNSCFRIGFSNKEILSLSAHKHSLVISIRTLKRLCQRLLLFRRKNHTNLEEVAAFLQTETAGNGQMKGIDATPAINTKRTCCITRHSKTTDQAD
ncbi:hypothetical protein LDENG_00109780 [Lucifuga dentata]|nr:hypothetical protein LDENG_00167000 [Lucifuga dentata]KAF7651511.1 hypothetical protein LDENG_00109780 [Lucifuga dentata]